MSTFIGPDGSFQVICDYFVFLFRAFVATMKWLLGQRDQWLVSY